MLDPANTKARATRTVGIVSSLLRCLLLASLITLLPACSTCQRLPEVDTSGPEWAVRQGGVAWTPKRKAATVAGELVFASNKNGHVIAQFSKASFPMVNFQSSRTNWGIEFPSRGYCFSGKGQPPSRFAWLYLPRALKGASLPKCFRFRRDAFGAWRLENINTGETLEGFFSE